MRLKVLQLKNFRCFEDMKIDFDPAYTVLIGINGAGKSSILDGVSIALGSFLAALDGVASNALHQDDVRFRMYEQGSIPNREPQYPAQLEACVVLADGTEVSWGRALNGANGRTTVRESRPIADYAANLQKAVRKGRTESILPLVAYYGTGRLWAQKQTRRARNVKRQTLSSRLKGYKDCLSAVSNEKMMLAWFADMTYLQLQEGRPIPELIAVQQAVADCYIGIDSTAESVQVRFSVKYAELEIVVHHPGGELEYLPLHLLSDGIRTILSMVADIAYRMAVLNPQLLGNVLKETDGIVLIDEIDMHLHPAWQRRIIQDLLRIFPKVQFIFTTHAPTVLTNTGNENLRILEQGQVHRPAAKSYGRNLAAIMGEIMGTEARPGEVLAKIAQFNDALDQGNLDKAKTLLRWLERKLGPDDQDVVNAQIALDLEGI